MILVKLVKLSEEFVICGTSLSSRVRVRVSLWLCFGTFVYKDAFLTFLKNKNNDYKRWAVVLGGIVYLYRWITVKFLVSVQPGGPKPGNLTVITPGSCTWLWFANKHSSIYHPLKPQTVILTFLFVCSLGSLCPLKGLYVTIY